MTTTSYSGELHSRPGLPAHLRRRNSVPNQLLFRELNEQLYLRGGAHGFGAIELVCECDRRGCEERLRIARTDYDATRRFPTRFLVLPGHEALYDERVVEDHGGFVVVEKTGATAPMAIRLDPRRRERGSLPAA